VAARRFSHLIGFDDGPFDRAHRGDVLVVGAVYSMHRLEGVLSGRVRRDGRNATSVLVELCTRSRFAPQLQLVLLQGIALAGFNVVDIHELHERTGLPVLVVARRRPDLGAIERALRAHVRGGVRKWRLIERAGPMERCGSVWVQRVGLAAHEAAAVLLATATGGHLPEPLRTAHIIAGGVARGESSRRA
jgi:endonuclease V-like protein UPF0215 family